MDHGIYITSIYNDISKIRSIREQQDIRMQSNIPYTNAAEIRKLQRLINRIGYSIDKLKYNGDRSYETLINDITSIIDKERSCIEIDKWALEITDVFPIQSFHQ